jgi:signal transduction histidine kinase/ActR/RegA family two-component response regulator
MAEAVPTAGRVSRSPSRSAATGRPWPFAVPESLLRAPRLAAAISILVGGLALLGWILGQDALKSIVPGTLTMKANTAICFLLFGLGLLISDLRPDRRGRLVGAVLGAMAGVIAAAVGLQYVFGVDFGIDHLLFVEPPGAVGTVQPGRMSPQAATGFVLLALALPIAHRRGARWFVVALVAMPLLLGARNIANLAFDAAPTGSLAAFTPMALPTAFAFIALSLGTLALQPDGGPFAVLRGAGPGSLLARRLLVAAVAIPLIVGWLALEGIRRGLYDTAQGVAFVAITCLLLFVVVTLWTARMLERADAGRRKAEAALVQARQIAEDARLEAEEARADAEQASHAKSDFLSRMSHELRTPLNAVLGFAQLLAMDELAPAQRENVGQISKAGRHLLELINEVLDIARIEAGRLSLSIEPVEVQLLIEEAIALVEPLAAGRGVQIARDSEAVVVMADRHRLRQVLLNLLSNAVKYDRPGGHVRVSTKLEGERWRILVSDTGPGLTPDKLARLFVPFDRLGAEASDVEGTGIGLALSRRLAEAMGGTMGVQSEPGEGSTFWIELPPGTRPLAAQLDLAHDVPVAATDPDLVERTVLYIEDNPSNVKLMERILERQPGVRLLIAGHGRLGLDLARQHSPSLVLLDLNLPDISGQQVLAELRADPRLRQVPVVVISADATPGQITRLRDAGADEYLTKPLDVSLLLDIVRRSLERTGTQA